MGLDMYAELIGGRIAFAEMTMKGNNQFSIPASDSKPSMRLVGAVANELGVDPMELPPLYEKVDPEALDTLFQTSRPAHPDDRIELDYEGCQVAVYGTGKIEVNGSKEDQSPVSPGQVSQQDGQGEVSQASED